MMCVDFSSMCLCRAKVLVIILAIFVKSCEFCKCYENYVNCASRDYNEYNPMVLCGEHYNIDLHNNSFRTFPLRLRNFTNIDLSNNKINKLYVYEKQEVIFLNVAYNQLQEIVLENNFHSLRYLQASHNALDNKIVFLKECNLRKLLISYNKLQSLEEIFNCNQLEVLDASYNLIRKLTDAVRKLNNLQVLILANNLITTVEDLPALLKVLDLSGNKIITMPSFTGDYLTTLILSNNNIKSLNSINIVNYTNLEVLDLSYNMLEKIQPEFFFGDSIEFSSFSDPKYTFPSLRTLNFSNNNVNDSDSLLVLKYYLKVGPDNIKFDVDFGGNTIKVNTEITFLDISWGLDISCVDNQCSCGKLTKLTRSLFFCNQDSVFELEESPKEHHHAVPFVTTLALLCSVIVLFLAVRKQKNEMIKKKVEFIQVKLMPEFKKKRKNLASDTSQRIKASRSLDWSFH